MGAPFSASLVKFTKPLRAAGLSIGIEQPGRVAEAFRWIDASNKTSTTHAMRATLLSRREDLEVFDAVFNTIFGGPSPAHEPQKTPQAPRHDPTAFQRTALAAFVAEKANEADVAIELADRSGTASSAEVL